MTNGIVVRSSRGRLSHFIVTASGLKPTLDERGLFDFLSGARLDTVGMLCSYLA